MIKCERWRSLFSLAGFIWLALTASDFTRPIAIMAAPGFLCSAGSNDGLECDFDSDCPNGACLAGQNICNAGTADGDTCESSADCGGGVCTLTARVCDGGDNRGFACVRPVHCPAASCVTNGRFCFGGDFDRFACVRDADCEPEGGEAGTCRRPVEPVLVLTLCSAGPSDGQECEDDTDCPSGACVVAQTVCDGGDLDGQFCEADTDCPPGNSCTLTQRICTADAGDLKGFGCMRNAHCPGGLCIASGRVCFGGDFDFFSCIDDADCGTEDTGSCEAPGEAVPTPSFSRRPTPVPTPTRGQPGRLPTPTENASGPGPDENGCTFVDGICVRRKREGSCNAGSSNNESLVVLALLYAWLYARRRRMPRRTRRRN